MRLRVQHRGGQCVVTVGDDARLADLRAAVEAAVGIPHRRIWEGAHVL